MVGCFSDAEENQDRSGGQMLFLGKGGYLETSMDCMLVIRIIS